MKWSYEKAKLEQSNDVNDQTRGEIFKQAAEENIYPPNTISAEAEHYRCREGPRPPQIFLIFFQNYISIFENLKIWKFENYK